MKTFGIFIENGKYNYSELSECDKDCFPVCVNEEQVKNLVKKLNS